LEKRMDLKLFDKDIFVNVVGGMKIDDPAVDMAVCLAIGSSLTDRVVPEDTVVLGEVGLAAEVRSVTNIALRANEARKLGFKRCLLPRANHAACRDLAKGSEMEFIPVADLRAAFGFLGKSII